MSHHLCPLLQDVAGDHLEVAYQVDVITPAWHVLRYMSHIQGAVHMCVRSMHELWAVHVCQVHQTCQLTGMLSCLL
jgi:hypothetical protein